MPAELTRCSAKIRKKLSPITRLCSLPRAQSSKRVAAFACGRPFLARHHAVQGQSDRNTVGETLRRDKAWASVRGRRPPLFRNNARVGGQETRAISISPTDKMVVGSPGDYGIGAMTHLSLSRQLLSKASRPTAPRIAGSRNYASVTYRSARLTCREGIRAMKLGQELRCATRHRWERTNAMHAHRSTSHE